jgi:hypothetical protein
VSVQLYEQVFTEGRLEDTEWLEDAEFLLEFLDMPANAALQALLLVSAM